MIVADFFSGLGGFTEGAQRAGARPVFAANHWPLACEWHHRNHPEIVPVQQDLQQLDMRLLPDLSEGLLVASPACQGHSQNSQPARAGTGGSHSPRAGAQQERSILQRSTAWAVVSAAEIARPRTILVENVADFLAWSAAPRGRDGKMFAAWKGTLEALGYSVVPHVIDARDYGTPQARIRAVVTCRLGAPLHLAPSWGPPAPPVGTCIDADGPRWADIDRKSERMRWRMRKAQREAGARCLWNNVSDVAGRPLDGAAPTLTTKSGSQLYLLDGDRARILSPRELARIQGFGDHYHVPTSRSPASALIGNAIPVGLAEGIVAQSL